MKANKVEDIYALSPMQQGLLFHTLYAPQTGAYFEQVAYALEGDFGDDLFERAWQNVLNRHTVLRTSFHWGDIENPVQIVHRQVQLPFARHDWRELPAEEQDARLQKLLQEDRVQGFDLEKPPLMRMALIRSADNAYYFVLSYHHILLDGWAMPLVLKEVLAGYEALCRGKELTLPAPRPYRDYITWLRKQDISRAETFWRQQLKGFTAPTRLGFDRSSGLRDQKTAQYEHHQRLLPPEVLADLQALARQQKVTLNTLIQGAWAILLSRYSGQDDVVFGTTVSGRPADLPGVESMVGLFINTMPVRVQVPAEETLAPWLQRLHAHQSELRDYEYCPLSQVLGWSEVPRIVPLFESLVVFENYPVDPSVQGRNGNLKFRRVHAFERTNYPLTLVGVPRRELVLRVLYDDRRFEAKAVDRMLTHLEVLLSGMAANLQQPLSALPILTPAERQQVLGDWTGGRAVYPKGPCLPELFEAQVEPNPEAIAVVCEGQALTYQELNKRANQLAHHLRGMGVGPGLLVGLYIERSLDLVVGILGILKAGGAYVPLDPASPSERLAFMLTDAQVPVLLTQQSLIDQLPAHQVPTVCLDADPAPWSGAETANPVPGTGPDHPTYVIYTSGSTGQPKGVPISHYNVVRLFQATQDLFHFDAQDVWTLFHSYAFDFSVWELWGALLYGGRLVVVPYLVSRSPQKFADLLRKEGVTVLNQTPSAFRQLAEEEEQGAAADLKLRLVILGGEALDLGSLRPWFARHGDQRPRLVNMYGITETTVHVTYKPLTEADLVEAPASLIGKPIPDLRVYVLDRQFQPVPIGVPAEVHVGGAGVASGYLNRPELTAEKFIPDPFGKPGDRLYKTGDQARWREDGSLEYLGRLDFQVKIRGFRIELGEIEASLGEYPGVKQVVVIVRYDDPNKMSIRKSLYQSLAASGMARDVGGEKMLVAYLVPEPDADLSTAKLRDYLKQRVPEFMVPSAFVFLEALPLNTNGKLDRPALPPPERQRADLSTPYLPPQTELENLLAGMWKELLKIDRIGRHDSFFELGGNSIKVLTLAKRLQTKLGERVEVSTLFEAPHLAGLAAQLRERHRDAVARVCPGEPFQEVENGAPAAAGNGTPSIRIPASFRSTLVLLQEHGTRPPFFCVHAAGGNVYCFGPLARRVGSAQPFVGIQAPGLQNDGEVHTSLANMAAHYVAAMRSVQPEGPYYLGGWSLGGLVALEMAQQLHAQHQELGLLGILDTFIPASVFTPPAEREAAHREFNFHDLLERWAHFVGLSTGHLLDMKEEDKLGLLLEQAQHAGFMPPDMNPDQSQRWLKVLKANMQALATYAVQPYPGTVTLLRAGGNKRLKDMEADYGWSKVGARVDIVDVTGNHLTIVKEPNVKDLGEKLRICLEEVQAARQVVSQA